MPPGPAHVHRPPCRRLGGILVAGWEASSNRRYHWYREGVAVGEWPGNTYYQRGHEPDHFRTLVARWQTAGDRKYGWHRQGLGCGRRPRGMPPQGAHRQHHVRILVAGWQTAGDRKYRWHGEGVGRSG